jgi:hypothetical protein
MEGGEGEDGGVRTLYEFGLPLSPSAFFFHLPHQPSVNVGVTYLSSFVCTSRFSALSMIP